MPYTDQIVDTEYLDRLALEAELINTEREAAYTYHMQILAESDDDQP